MKYTFTDYDGRDYTRGPDGLIIAKTAIVDKRQTRLGLLTSCKVRLELVLDKSEALAIAHALLATAEGGCKASISAMQDG